MHYELKRISTTTLKMLSFISYSVHLTNIETQSLKITIEQWTHFTQHYA